MAGLAAPSTQSGGAGRMNHLMIDIETLGTSPTAPVVSIGAVLFNIANGDLGRQFHVKIALDLALKGRQPDSDTIKWWMSQSDEAKKELDGVDGMHSALFQFSQWLKDFYGSVWSNGSCFDIVILEDLYRQYNTPIPWSFRDIKDMRTIKFLARGCPIDREGTHHNALDDAIYQAKCVSWMFNNLK